jgi:hypothetical protein
MNIHLIALFTEKKYLMKIDNIYFLILGGSKFAESRIKPICRTWLGQCNNYLISTDGELGKNIKHEVVTQYNDCHSCPPKIFKGMEFIINEKSHCEWLFIADDDTYVNLINLNSFIKLLDVKEDKMYGKDMTGFYPYNGKQIKYLSGGGGTLLPMHVAGKMIDKAKKENWFDWLCLPRQIPPKHQKDYPTASGADTKLGWLGNQINIKQLSYPHLFYPEGYKKYNHLPENILQCITYHRQCNQQQDLLHSIVYKDVSKNKLSLEPLEPIIDKTKEIKNKNSSKSPVRNPDYHPITSYYINTEIMLLHKKIEKLEKEIYKNERMG